MGKKIVGVEHYNRQHLKDMRTLKNQYDKEVFDKHHNLEDNQRNRDMLISFAHPMIESQVSRRYSIYHNSDHIHRDDIYQSGMMGAIDAVTLWFNKSIIERRKYRNFNEFAFIWVEKHIKQYLNNASYQVSHRDNEHKVVKENALFVNGDSYSVDHGNTLFNAIEDETPIIDFDMVVDFRKQLVDSLSEFLDDTEITCLFIYFGILDISKKEIMNIANIKFSKLTEYINGIISKLKDNLSEDIFDKYEELISDSAGEFKIDII